MQTIFELCVKLKGIEHLLYLAIELKQEMEALEDVKLFPRVCERQHDLEPVHLPASSTNPVLCDWSDNKIYGVM